MMSAPFKNRVAIITGAGGGLGRIYALSFAAAGAKVVVNDVSPTPASGVHLKRAEKLRPGQRAAEAVVSEIRSLGGEAVADFHDVCAGEEIAATALKAFGRVDILINNAGILRDVSFAKMSLDQMEAVLRVHLRGSFACTKAVWPLMIQQKYGRILNITSASGLYGNYGQANYGAAKMAVVGLTKTLALEGQKYNIHVNALAPLAKTAMTESVLPAPLLSALKPDHVAPVALYLCLEECTQTGQIFETGAGWISKVRFQRSAGCTLPKPISLDSVSSHWSSVLDFTKNAQCPSSLHDAISKVAGLVEPSSLPEEKEASPSSSEPFLSAKIFALLGAYFQRAGAACEALRKKVDCLFHFEIQRREGESLRWTVDLRAVGEGDQREPVLEGFVGSPVATFSLSDADFASVCTGQLNPQVAYLQGKMKIRGSLAKASLFTPSLFPPIDASLLKLSVAEAVQTFLNKTLDKASSSLSPAPPTSTETATSTPPKKSGEDAPLSVAASKCKSASLYPHIRKHLRSEVGKALAPKINCVYRVNILPKDSKTPVTFYIDMKQAPPLIYEAEPECTDTFDCSFTLSDDLFYDIATGKANAQMAFMQGKMKLKGSTRAAMKFSRDLFPTISRL